MTPNLPFPITDITIRLLIKDAVKSYRRETNVRNYGTDIFVVESIAVFDTIHKNLCPVTVPVKTFIIPFFCLGQEQGSN